MRLADTTSLTGSVVSPGDSTRRGAATRCRPRLLLRSAGTLQKSRQRLIRCDHAPLTMSVRQHRETVASPSGDPWVPASKSTRKPLSPLRRAAPPFAPIPHCPPNPHPSPLDTGRRPRASSLPAPVAPGNAAHAPWYLHAPCSRFLGGPGTFLPGLRPLSCGR